MDGSVTKPLSDSARAQFARGVTLRSANDMASQGDLFEHILNLTFIAEPPPELEPAQMESAGSSIDETDSQVPETQDTSSEEDPSEDYSDTPVATYVPGQPVVDLQPSEKPYPPESDKKLVVCPKPTEEGPANLGGALEKSDAVPASDQTMLDPGVKQSDQAVVENMVAADKGDQEPTRPVESLDELEGRRSKPSKEDKNGGAAKLVDAKASPDASGTEDVKAKQESEKPEADKDLIAKSQPETRVNPNESNSDSKDGRRGDRREKWFQRDSVGSASEATEASREARSELPERELSDKLNPLQAIDSSSAMPSSDKSMTAAPLPASDNVSIAVPATAASVQVMAASAVQVNAAQSNSAQSSTSAGNSNAAPVSSTEPTRTVGNRSAKADSKQDVEQPQVSQQERVRVIQRIARSFNRISSEGGQINIRLHPEHLGSVSVQVRLEGRTLTARLATETTAARDAIMQDLPALRQRLADQGFDVAKFQVDVAGNGADSSFTQSNSQSQSDQSHSRTQGAVQTDYRRIAARRESSVAYARTAIGHQVPIGLDRNSIDLQA